MYCYYLQLFWNLVNFKCCRSHTVFYETIKFEEQDETECFMCNEEYNTENSIVLLHGKDFPTHNVCLSCIKTYDYKECPFCRTKV